jgi:hypothetical protein
MNFILLLEHGEQKFQRLQFTCSVMKINVEFQQFILCMMFTNPGLLN